MTEVGRAAGITPEEAERAVEATLRTLAERLTRGEADDIAAFLPRELRSFLTDVPEPAEAFGRDEFVRRVAEREGVDEATAADHVRAVFAALGAAVAPGELRDMAAQLPKDFADLLETAGVGRSRALEDGDLVHRVGRLAGVDHERARRLTEAVLETLAVRISAGEVEDLAAELPADLASALARGLETGRAAKPMSADEFVTRVAARAHVAPDEARELTRAVFAALREALPGKEFDDMAAQLSRDYDELLASAR